jgi:hypothetical protein
MLDRAIDFVLWEWRAISRAPVTFAVLVLLLAGVISLALRWQLREDTTQLRQQLSDYRDKLGGASPAQAKAALDALTDEVTALQAQLKPRRVSAQQRESIAERLKSLRGTASALTIVHEGPCFDCAQFAADFDGVFRSIPGWAISTRVIMGLVQRPPHGLAVVVADPGNPSPFEAALLQALQGAGIALDLQGARSPLERGPQLLLAAMPAQ